MNSIFFSTHVDFSLGIAPVPQGLAVVFGHCELIPLTCGCLQSVLWL